MNHSIVRYILVAVLIGLAGTAVSAALLSQNDHAVQGTLRFTEATIKPVTSLKWDPLTVPCPWNDTWCPNGDPPVRQYRILVDLGHAERVTLDGAVSPNLDRSSNSRLFDWQDWANDMRAQGYEVRVTTVKPITATELANTDLYIVAQPDSSKNGPVYFTQAEKDAIACFVLKGNTLLVMAQQFMGGKDQTQYLADMKTSYASAAVINDLLKGVHVEGRFTEGKVSSGVLDIMDSESAGTQVFAGNPPDIWLPADGLKPEMKPDTFAGFHVLSIKPKTVQFLVRSDSTSFTSPKNAKYSPVVQAAGSRPIAIGLNGLGCGRVYLYGDPSAWQKETSFGKVYTEPKYHEQDAARVLVARMLSFNRTCEPCQAKEQPTQAQQTVKPTLTPKGDANADSCEICLQKCGTDQTCASDCEDAQGKVCSKLPQVTGMCEGCLQKCGTDQTCASECKDAQGKVCMKLPQVTGMCEGCLQQCGTDQTCASECKDAQGKVCMKLPQVTGMCEGCLQQCGTDQTCASNCKDAQGKVCMKLPQVTGMCEGCLQKCGTDQTCASECKDAQGKVCMKLPQVTGMCEGCLQQCGTDQTCSSKCKDATGIACVFGNSVTDTCDTCFKKCGDDTSCQNSCKDKQGKACGSVPLDYALTCEGCLQQCGTDQTCASNCKDKQGKACGSVPRDYSATDNCQVCLQKCGTDQACSSKCKDASGIACVFGNSVTDTCDTCFKKCGDDMSCQNSCKDPVTGNSCERLVVSPGSASGCLACYQACASSAATKKGVFGSEKTSEVALTCQQKCDRQYDTTIAQCACSNTVCTSGQHKELQVGSSLSCKCINDVTLVFNQTDLSSQWTGHNVGTPIQPAGGAGTNCQQTCKEWFCTDTIPSTCTCLRYETICT